MAMSPGGPTEPENERSCKGAQCALQVQGAQCMEPGASSSASSEAPPPGWKAGVGGLLGCMEPSASSGGVWPPGPGPS